MTSARIFFFTLALAALLLPARLAHAGGLGDSAWSTQSWSTPKPSAESVLITRGAITPDPFAVLSSGALWQEKSAASYTRQVDPGLALTCASSRAAWDDVSGSQTQNFGIQFNPLPEFYFHGDFHGSTSETALPADSKSGTGAAFSAQGQLPTKAIVTVGLHLDRTASDAPSGLATETEGYEAKVEQPLGKLPLSAVLKSRLTSAENEAGSTFPTLEQSLVWKPAQNTTVEMGLRQQQYQEYPGVNHPLNEALFAEWSQKVLDNVSWHSYAEVLNSKSLVDQAPASAISSGTNGTPQQTTPGSTAGLTSALPVSLTDQTVTFSTGPSFKLQKDLSANLEYSNRWDKNPAPGEIGTEQRVSVSVKGSF